MQGGQVVKHRGGRIWVLVGEPTENWFYGIYDLAASRDPQVPRDLRVAASGKNAGAEVRRIHGAGATMAYAEQFAMIV
jgi:hypothetical protein